MNSAVESYYRREMQVLSQIIAN